MMPRAKLLPGLFLMACSFFLLGSLAGCSNNSATPGPFTVGGTAADLATTGGGLTLRNNDTNTLILVNANGSFTFPDQIPGGGAYNITISAQPSGPAQTCSVTNGMGTVSADVNDVFVECGHNEWAWMTGTNAPSQSGVYGTMGTAAAANTPGSRQAAATWTDSSDNLWLFGGYGYDSAGTLAELNDLWKYSGGQWTWMGGSKLAEQVGSYGTLGSAAAGNIPGARFQSVAWTDKSGNFWLFGGLGYDSSGSGGSLNDLWKYSAGQWTWMGGSQFANQKGTYGSLGVAAASNVPGARYDAVGGVDALGNFWLFGGLAYDSSGTVVGEINDLWKYSPSAGQWTWMSGSSTMDQLGVYGTKGTAASGNAPGARIAAAGSASV